MTMHLKRLSIFLAGALLCSSIARADSLLSKRIDRLEGQGPGIYSALCEKLAGSCGVFVDTSLTPLLSKSSFTNESVKNILQAIVPQKGPYMWRIDNGVLNILPRYVSKGDLPLVSQSTHSWKLSGVTSRYAAQVVTGKLTTEWQFIGARPSYGTVNLDLKDVTLLAALNRIVAADGMTYWTISRTKGAQSEYAAGLITTRMSGNGRR